MIWAKISKDIMPKILTHIVQDFWTMTSTGNYGPHPVIMDDDQFRKLWTSSSNSGRYGWRFLAWDCQTNSTLLNHIVQNFRARTHDMDKDFWREVFRLILPSSSIASRIFRLGSKVLVHKLWTIWIYWSSSINLDEDPHCPHHASSIFF